MTPQEHEIMRGVEDHYWWYRALRRHIVDSIEADGPSFSLLDAGCGSGGMLATLRAHFPQADLTGIDESQQAIELCSNRQLRARLLRANVQQLPFPADSFDFVLSVDVWTHAGIDDALAAHETFRVLRPGGKLIINLAAFEFLRGAHDTAVETVRRYTRPQVRGLLAGAGFEIERLTYWNAALMPPIALFRWLSRKRLARGGARSDFRPLTPSVNAILTRLAALELTTSRHLSLPFGTSVFAVAQKHG